MSHFDTPSSGIQFKGPFGIYSHVRRDEGVPGSVALLVEEELDIHPGIPGLDGGAGVANGAVPLGGLCFLKTLDDIRCTEVAQCRLVFGSKFNGQVLGTFGKYGVLSFNGNKMITTSGGGALITANEDEWREIMMYATQYRESYPYYQHEKIGYNYRMSNICAGIGRGQMTVVNDHIAHHKHVQKLYEELLKDVPGVQVHSQPTTGEYDSNYWLCTITIDENVKIKGQENAYKTIVKGAVGGAAGVIHIAESAHTDCEPNANVEALRVFMDEAGIEARPVWKPMHKQPVYKDAPAYVNGVSEAVFKVGMCLPAGPYVTDDDVRYIVETIKNAIAC